MPRLSKKEKQEWDFFINPKTGKRTYNSLCLKCKNKCRQSYRAVIVYCRKFKSKRSVIAKDDKQHLQRISSPYKRKNCLFRHQINTETEVRQ